MLVERCLQSFYSVKKATSYHMVAVARQTLYFSQSTSTMYCRNSYTTMVELEAVTDPCRSFAGAHTHTDTARVHIYIRRDALQEVRSSGGWDWAGLQCAVVSGNSMPQNFRTSQ